MALAVLTLVVFATSVPPFFSQQVEIITGAERALCTCGQRGTPEERLILAALSRVVEEVRG
jgi:hypothetical protein